MKVIVFHEEKFILELKVDFKLKKILAFVLILRPVNFLLTFVSIYYAITLANSSLALSFKAFAGSLAGALISGAGMIINDILDFEIDKINRPERPLPSSLISLRFALVYYILLNLVSLYLLLCTSIEAFIIGLLSMVIIFFYSFSFKKRGLIGNFVVGFMTGLAFIFGGVIGGNVKVLIFPAVFALMINFAREILKDIEDIEGDKQLGLKTFPIQYGTRKAFILFSIITELLIVITFIPYVIRVYNFYYLVIVFFSVDLLLIYVLKNVLSNPSKDKLRKFSNLIKYDMIFGLIAIYVGSK